MVASLDAGTRHREPAEGARAAAFAAPAITPARAALLGGVQGPAELLPVSSSAHLSLLPWLARWRWDELDPEARKAFEVALHAATAAALLVPRPAGDRGATRLRGVRGLALGALSLAPPAIAGYALERQIERRLGGPGATAAGLLAGAAALGLADRRPEARAALDATALDAAALGLAQAAALAPGVSRSGATLAAARARRFSRGDAALLSRAVAIPVLVGAGALKGARLARRGVDPGLRRALLAGAAASFASTLASRPLVERVEAGRPLWPYAAYRAGLASLVLTRLRRCG